MIQSAKLQLRAWFGTPSPVLFDERYYQSQRPAKRPAKSCLWDDYRKNGWKQGLNPHPLFDVKWYLDNNPDVKAAGVEPLAHYLTKGWKEGRNPNAYFQTDWYLANKPELLNQAVNPLLHYLEKGWKNGCDPGSDFSIRRYFDASPHAERTVEPLGVWMEEVADAKPVDKSREYVRWPTTYIPSGVQPRTARNSGRVAVQLHAFYLEKLGVILDHLKHIPVPFDLLVSTDAECHAQEIEERVAQAKLECSLDIRCVQNRGRDVAPLICLFGKKLLEYDYALHLHTKKSANVKFKADEGHDWLMHNLGFLVRNGEYVEAILSLFCDDPKCGVLAPKPWKGIRDKMAWTSNRSRAEGLMERLRLPKTTLNTQPLMFPGGTMFWFRPAALRPLLASDLRFDDFSPEPLPKDGTLAHAIERCIFYIALFEGYHSLVIAPSIFKPVS